MVAKNARQTKKASKKKKMMHQPHHTTPQSRQAVATRASQPKQTLMPYDENLLERSCTQWQFGDWQSLTKLNRDTLQHHPDRAKLALLAAAGHLQTSKSDNTEAKQFIRLAQDWGIDKKLIGRVLIAGVHNNLARAAAVAKQEKRAWDHFEKAISIGAPSSATRLLTQARINEQFQQLGLNNVITTHGRQFFLSQANSADFEDEIPVDNLNLPSFFYKLAAELQPTGASLNKPSFILLGPARTGKTLLAQKLCKAYGYAHLRLDEIFYVRKKKQPDLPCDFQTMLRYYHLLFNLYPNGLIMESDSLFQVAEEKRAFENAQKLPVVLKKLQLGKESIYLMGSVHIDMRAKINQIIAFRNEHKCWTKSQGLNEEDLKTYVQMWNDYSKIMQSTAIENSIRYFEVDIFNFDQSIEQVANEIATNKVMA